MCMSVMYNRVDGEAGAGLGMITEGGQAAALHNGLACAGVHTTGCTKTRRHGLDRSSPGQCSGVTRTH